MCCLSCVYKSEGLKSARVFCAGCVAKPPRGRGSLGLSLDSLAAGLSTTCEPSPVGLELLVGPAHASHQKPRSQSAAKCRPPSLKKASAGPCGYFKEETAAECLP